VDEPEVPEKVNEPDGYTLKIRCAWQQNGADRHLELGLSLANDRLFVKTTSSDLAEGDRRGLGPPPSCQEKGLAKRDRLWLGRPVIGRRLESLALATEGTSASPCDRHGPFVRSDRNAVTPLDSLSFGGPRRDVTPVSIDTPPEAPQLHQPQDDGNVLGGSNEAMKEADERRTLLGRLAGQGWFTKHGEVAATSCLAFLLEEEPLRVALLNHLETHTGKDLAGVTQFIPEAMHADKTRLDLEGRDDAGLPLVEIEAKLAAALTHQQLLTYMRQQESGLGPHSSGAFVVLVPSHRTSEAQTLLDSMRPDFAEPPVLATHVLTWDKLFEVLDSAAATALHSSTAIAADLLQLRDLCMTLQGLDITPLGDAASGRGWAKRRTDLERIVERVTAQLSGDHALLPTGKDSLYTFRRYVNQGPGSFCAVGIVGKFADRGDSPLWLRYHSQTPHFQEIEARLRSSDLEDRARDDQGHIWLPLTVPNDLSGAAIVAAIGEEVRGINGALSDA
jgi:hypothetical protein